MALDEVDERPYVAVSVEVGTELVFAFLDRLGNLDVKDGVRTPSILLRSQFTVPTKPPTESASALLHDLEQRYASLSAGKKGDSLGLPEIAPPVSASASLN